MRQVLMALVLAVPMAAWADEASRSPLSQEQENAAIKAAETTGLAMFRHDRATALASDAVLRSRGNNSDQRMAGWITEDVGSGVAVTFIDRTPAALYRVVVADNGALAGPVVAHGTALALSEFEAGAAAARASTLKAGFSTSCAEKYNSIVLPKSESRPNSWSVHWVPGTTKSNFVPVGGSYRFDLEGGDIGSHRGFTRTCIALDNDPKAVGLVISHLLDPVPTEVHVYWSLWAKRTMFVAIPGSGTIWMIEGGKIKLAQRGPAKG